MERCCVFPIVVDFAAFSITLNPLSAPPRARIVMKTKLAVVAIAALFLLALTVSTSYVGAEEVKQASYSLRNFDVQVTYPDRAEPGKVVTVQARATAKYNVYVVELRIQVTYYSSGGTLVPLVSENLASNVRVSKGSLIQRDISVSIPTDLPRGGLVGFVGERVRYTVYYYYPYFFAYNYTYYYGFPYYYVSGDSYESTDAGILPLTYVLSPTPEYIALKGQYGDLNSRYNTLAQQFEQLKVDHQLNLDKLNELTRLQEATSLRLEDARNTINILSIIAVVLSVAVVGLFALYIRERQRKITEQNNTRGKSNLRWVT